MNEIKDTEKTDIKDQAASDLLESCDLDIEMAFAKPSNEDLTKMANALISSIKTIQP